MQNSGIKSLIHTKIGINMLENIIQLRGLLNYIIRFRNI